MIYTIGHSTRTIGEFMEILRHYGIEILADVRHFPSSKKFPWFSKEELERSLEKAGIGYFWLGALGGFRAGGYLEYTKSEEYKSGIKKLLEISKQGKTLVMCAEILWFRCHRKHISGTLAEMGYDVVHIYGLKRMQEHKSMEAAEQMKLKIFCDKTKRKN